MTEYGICPIMGVGGHQCEPDCAWYIEGQGCAIPVIARSTAIIAKKIGYLGRE